MTNSFQSSHIQAALFAFFVCCIVLLLMWPTADSVIGIWDKSSTYTHGYFVVPVFIYLLWHKRDALLSSKPAPDWRILPLIVISSLLWLLGQQVGIQVLEHVALVCVLITSIWAIIGTDTASRIRFPLLFLFFLAPVGEELVPMLMELTADITVWAVRLTGIPIYREGLFFSLPSGNWSVVEACSGIRYLIASVVLGSVYAYVNFSSDKRKFLFIAVAALVPIIANSVRAFLIVMLGHFSGNKLAAGVDHLVYGWLFFGLVMGLLFYIGSLFHDKHKADNSSSDDSNVTLSDQSFESTNSLSAYILMCGLAIVAVSTGLIWSASISANNSAARLTLTQAEFSTLLPESTDTTDNPENGDNKLWQPSFHGFDHKLTASYTDESSVVVKAMAFVYVEQKQGKEMISSANRLIGNSRVKWRVADKVNISIPNGVDESESDIESLKLVSSSGSLNVRRWYSINGVVTVSPIEAKLYELYNRLRLNNAVSVHYVLTTESDGEEAEQALDKISASLLNKNSKI